jgi:hypothetical protein
MSHQRLRDIHRELLKLKRLGVSGRKKFLKTCSNDCINKISECAKNLLNENILIKPSHLKKLSRHKHTLRALVLKKTAVGKRRRLMQKGGFLHAFLPALIPAIAGLVRNLMSDD